MARLSIILPGLCGLALLAATAAAQVVPPFFSPEATAFTPEISVVNTGIIQDVQVVVGPDPRYVTLNAMSVGNARLLALREFTFQNAQDRFGANLPSAGPAALADRGVSLLARRGLTRVDRP